MTHYSHDPIDTLVAELRRAAKAEAADARVTVSGDRLRLLADELSRLLQSSAFLRRQNAKLRRRIERLKAGMADDDAEASDADLPTEG
ncbi:MAG: hypothetical protein R3F56_12075 [Planctomycetota bacterium]